MANNNEASAAGATIGFIAAGMFFVAAAAFAIGLFISILLTLWCLYAWNEPRTLFGQTTTPEEARGFVYRGLAGMVIAPVFAAFAAALLHFRIQDDWWGYLILAGYAIGSVGIGIEIEKAKAAAAQQAADQRALLPPEPARSLRTIDAAPIRQPVQPAQDGQESFRFATWDDEEELRK